MPSEQAKGGEVGVGDSVGIGLAVGVEVAAAVGIEVTSATGQSPLVLGVATSPTLPFEQPVQYWPELSMVAQTAYLVPWLLDI